VLGLGNILLRDEGVGVRVVEALAAGGLPPGVEAADGGTAGVDLIELLAGRQRVIVVDAVAGDEPPGTVLRLSEHDLAADRFSLSVHDFDLPQVLALARKLGVAPESVEIIGVRPFELGVGVSLSPRMAEHVASIEKEVRYLLDAPPCAATKPGSPGKGT